MLKIYFPSGFFLRKLFSFRIYFSSQRLFPSYYINLYFTLWSLIFTFFKWPVKELLYSIEYVWFSVLKYLLPFVIVSRAPGWLFPSSVDVSGQPVQWLWLRLSSEGDNDTSVALLPAFFHLFCLWPMAYYVLTQETLAQLSLITVWDTGLWELLEVFPVPNSIPLLLPEPSGDH